MVFAGIDFDTAAIHVVRLELDSDHARYDRIRLDVGPGDYNERARRIPDLIPARDAWRDSGVALIALEDPKGQTFRGSIPLAVIRGALLAALPRQHQTPLLLVPTQEWKKWSLGAGKPGKGNAAKELVAGWARRNWPDLPDNADQNAYDGYAIAYAARAICAQHIDAPTTSERYLALRKEFA